MTIPLDANIILRFILDDSPVLSPKAKIIFKKITKNKIKVFVNLLTISEVIFTLERSYKIPKSKIVKSLSQLFKLTGLTVEKQKLVQQALIFYVEQHISFPDAYLVAFMASKSLNQIISFDEDFDKFPEIKRMKE